MLWAVLLLVGRVAPAIVKENVAPAHHSRGNATLAASMSLHAHGEHEVLGDYCKPCPPGQHVSRPCDVGQETECEVCPSGTFMAHDNQEMQCHDCTPCRQDQEMVTECSSTTDRLCQCQQGRFYCDSPNCVEQCYRCHSCKGGVVLQQCNATRDTVCDGTDAGPRGDLGRPWPPGWSSLCVASFTLAVIATVLVL